MSSHYKFRIMKVFRRRRISVQPSRRQKKGRSNRKRNFEKANIE
ncbi:hypothetical protein D1AOALGA4SA_6617 [Olavius algarvensis Delta 1 endosymbiont]|nr:hypothetical protein D1AOALGA4SA_6617 [Olavius algarvensis Delta 1 endosymbiont]